MQTKKKSAALIFESRRHWKSKRRNDFGSITFLVSKHSVEVKKKSSKILQPEHFFYSQLRFYIFGAKAFAKPLIEANKHREAFERKTHHTNATEEHSTRGSIFSEGSLFYVHSQRLCGLDLTSSPHWWGSLSSKLRITTGDARVIFHHTEGR